MICVSKLILLPSYISKFLITFGIPVDIEDLITEYEMKYEVVLVLKKVVLVLVLVL